VNEEEIRLNVALIVVDMQSVFLQNHVTKAKIDRACEYINYVAQKMRSHRQPVVHIRDIEDLEHSSDPGAFETIPEIVVDPGDLKFTKSYTNAFWKTELEQELKSRDVTFVIVAGFAIEHCVLGTYQGAIERGFKAVLLHNGILGEHEDSVTSAYRDRNLISHPAIDFLLNVKDRA